jgi:tRNA (guanine-N7-)-methyltransferase
MRAGRMTEGQQRGLDQGGPLFVLPLADSPVDYDQVFGRSAPRTLEIGFGMGHSLLEMAAASPSRTSSVSKCTARVSARCSTAC